MRIRPLRALFAFSVCSLAFASSRAQVQASAPVGTLPQYSQRWDVDGGFSSSHFNPGIGRGVPALWLNGWNAGATAWLKPLIGVEFSARGYYGTINVPPNAYNVTTSNMSEHLFNVGPNFRIIRKESHAAGVHWLLGSAIGSFDQGFKNSGVQPYQVGIYNNKVAFAMDVGGYYDYNLTPQWSVRAIADWQPTHYGFTFQNEFAGTIGVVYKFGLLK